MIRLTLLFVFATASANASPTPTRLTYDSQELDSNEDVPYCFYAGDMWCHNLALVEGNGIKLNNETLNNKVRVLFLLDSSGVVDSKSFSYFPGLTYFHMSDCKIERLLPKSESLKYIGIFRSTVPKITAETFAEVKNLVTFEVRSSSELEIEAGSFKTLNYLKFIKIQGPTLRYLNKEFLGELKSLMSLYLNAKIENIDGDAFGQLPELKVLSLEGNKIKSFEPNTFKPLKKLEIIYLTNTTLDEFDLKLFTEQHELTDLGLPTTVLEKLNETELFTTFPNLKTIWFEGADRKCNAVTALVQRMELRGIGADLRYPMSMELSSCNH